VLGGGLGADEEVGVEHGLAGGFEVGQKRDAVEDAEVAQSSPDLVVPGDGGVVEEDEQVLVAAGGEGEPLERGGDGAGVAAGREDGGRDGADGV